MSCIIEVESITGAIKAKDLLKRNRFSASVEKNTGRPQRGCTYSVKVGGDCNKATELLEKNHIRMLGIS